jgi:hypothetical protein
MDQVPKMEKLWILRAGCSRVNYRGLRINVVNFSYVLKFFVADADPGSGIQKFFDPGYGMVKFGFGINIPDPQHC